MMVAPKRSKKPAISVTKIPSIKVLCDALGFQYADSKCTAMFMSALHSWRKTFKSSSGFDGPELLSWNDPGVQRDLMEMSEGFVRDSDNGERYWGPSRQWKQVTDLEFPIERSEIVELLMQLFWRQNRYSANNLQYVYKGGQNTNQSSSKTTTVNESASVTRLSSLDTVEPVIQRSTSSLEGRSSTTADRIQQREEMEAESVERRTDRERAEMDAFSDLFDGPFDNNFSPESNSLGPERNNDGTTSASAPNTSKKPTQPEHRPKRTSENNQPKKRKRISGDSFQSPRRTGRKRNTVIDPHLVSFSDLDDQLRSDHENPEDTWSSPQNGAQHQAQQNASPDSPKRHQPISSSNRFVAPVAPMTVTDISDDESPRPHFHGAATEGRTATSQMRAATMPPQGSNQQQHTNNNTVRPNSPQRNSPHLPPSNQRASQLPVTQLGFTERGSQSRNGSTSTENTSRVHNMTTAPIPQREAVRATTQSRESSVSKAKSKIQVSLWIITRQPRFTEERWDEGKFKGTPLSTFIQELSEVTGKSNIEKMKLTLRTPLKDTKVTVLKDADDQWESAKQDFAINLKEAVVEARNNSQMGTAFKILIEPIYNQNTTSFGASSGDEYDIEF